MTIQPPIPLSTATSAPDLQHAKLVDAAQSFEAMMLNQMLKPLHFGAAVDAGGDADEAESSGGAADTIRGMGTEALGKALASHGVLGIARKIVSEVSVEHNANNARKGGTKVA